MQWEENSRILLLSHQSQQWFSLFTWVIFPRPAVLVVLVRFWICSQSSNPMLSWHWVDILYWLMRIIYSGHGCVALCAVCFFEHMPLFSEALLTDSSAQERPNTVAITWCGKKSPASNLHASRWKFSKIGFEDVPKSKNVKPDIKSLNQTARFDFFFAMPLSLREENWYKDLEKCLLMLLVKFAFQLVEHHSCFMWQIKWVAE